MLNPQPGARLQVWGDPVAHSRSPQLHHAAYAVLGLDWTYDRRRVDEAAFPEALAGRPTVLRGVSATMPLKSAAWRASATRDRRAELTGAVNTVLLTDGGPHGFNTDVGGIVRDLREQGLDGLDRAGIIGGGATATSALVAVAELGARTVQLVTRRPPAHALRAVADRVGVRLDVRRIGEDRLDPVPVTIATLPGGAAVDPAAAAAIAASADGAPLFDVVYGHWPTVLAEAWTDAGGRATDGRGMLLQQALLQVRVFVLGDPDAALPAEAEVLAAMRAAVMGH